MSNLDQLLDAARILEADGYTIVSKEQRPDVFGNSLLVLTNAQLEVRLVYDRGQFFADVRLPGSHSWFDLGTLLTDDGGAQA